MGSRFYDVLGRLVSVQDTGGGVDAITYTQGDALSVADPAPSGENAKQVQNEYDGLGRLTSSCKISTTVSGFVSCGQRTGSYSGVLTTTSYSSATGSQTTAVTRGSQTRTTIMDALGRPTKITLPESGSTYYYYDGAPCGGTSPTFPGKLIGISYANGNSVCNWYDTLGRLIVSEAYNSSSILCRRLIYDSTSKGIVFPPSGSTIANTAGRLVEAETDSCPSGTITPITDEWFSYDKDGNMLDMWELTPHSGTYYHSTATFAGNGVPLTVQLANPNLYTETYGLDGEGRPATLTSGTQAIVSGTTFNAASQPTYIDLGTGTDQSSYVYDSLTGRMTNWIFQVGSATETGILTWNANWSLRQLVIDDGFNIGGSQTCIFGTISVMGYDDLGRLLSDNCGSVWAQTFSFDQYDNLTKAGSGTWNPGYNSANNHYNIGSYDNSGNLLNDTFHTYNWDPFGKLSSIDSTACATNGECVTYDALGRIVEASSAGAYTEIWYTQMGKGVYMKGSTPSYAYWPTPGGGTVEVNGNNATAYYMHKDWLGNARISSTIVNHTVVSDQAYAPYSEVYDKQATGAGVPGQMFTGDTQDILSGLFDTPNRELNSSQGRWLSPDPAGAGWNLYDYVTDPLTGVDPSGLASVPGASVNCGATMPGGVGPGPCGSGNADSTSYEFWDWDFISSLGPLPPQLQNSDAACVSGPVSAICFLPGPLSEPTAMSRPNSIFPGEDCVGCWSLGPSPLQILQAALSGNIWGALRGAGAIPQNPNCEFGACGDSYPGAMNAEPVVGQLPSYISDPLNGAADWWNNLNFELNAGSCDFMSAGVQTGDAGAVAGTTAATGGGAVSVATGGKLGPGVTTIGAGYAFWNKLYAKFWQKMKYFGGCSAYER